MNIENKKEEDFFGNDSIPEKNPENIFANTSASEPLIINKIVESTIKSSEHDSDRIEEPETFRASKLGNEIPKISTVGVTIPAEYQDVVDRINLAYEMLPSIDYNALYSELSSLGIRPTSGYIPAEIGRQLEEVQGAKDRVAEIYILVDRHCIMKKAFVNTLKNVWYKFCTKDSNKEKREGEANYIIHNYILDYAKIEALESTCKHIWSNLESTHKILQNKISVMQITVKLDYGTRSANTEYDFSKSSHLAGLSKNSSNNNDLNTLENNENKIIPTPEAEECSF